MEASWRKYLIAYWTSCKTALVQQRDIAGMSKLLPRCNIPLSCPLTDIEMILLTFLTSTTSPTFKGSQNLPPVDFLPVKKTPAPRFLWPTYFLCCEFAKPMEKPGALSPFSREWIRILNWQVVVIWNNSQRQLLFTDRIGEFDWINFKLGWKWVSVGCFKLSTALWHPVH